jgi:hypothetical protein
MMFACASHIGRPAGGFQMLQSYNCGFLGGAAAVWSMVHYWFTNPAWFETLGVVNCRTGADSARRVELDSSLGKLCVLSTS